MTTMPLIDLTRPVPIGTNYFPQLADGDNYTTEFLPPGIPGNGDTASALPRFFSAGGQPLQVPFQ